MFSKWRTRIRNIVRDILALWMGLRDPNVPGFAKLIGLAAGVAAALYVVLPIDIIPDIIPIVGWLDDLAVLPLATYVASRLIPRRLMQDLRDRADMKLMRWGPKVAVGALVFLVVWLGLAALGGWFFLRGKPAAATPAYDPMVPNLPLPRPESDTTGNAP